MPVFCIFANKEKNGKQSNSFGMKTKMGNKNSLNKSLFERILTDLYGDVGNPNSSQTYAAVGAAGSEAYATTPSTFNFRASSSTASLSVVLTL